MLVKISLNDFQRNNVKRDEQKTPSASRFFNKLKRNGYTYEVPDTTKVKRDISILSI